MIASTIVHLKAPCHQTSDPLRPPCDTDCAHGQLSLHTISILLVAEIKPAEPEPAEPELAEPELAESELACCDLTEAELDLSCVQACWL